LYLSPAELIRANLASLGRPQNVFDGIMTRHVSASPPKLNLALPVTKG
jgi:hypothetical protein